MRKYLFNILIGVDQLANTFIGGDPDETISSRAGKLVAKNECKLCKVLCWLLNKIDSNHCANSIEKDEGADASIQ